MPLLYAATFDLDSEGNVETNIQGYEHVSRQAPLPVCRTITTSRDAAGHFAFHPSLNQLHKILEEGRRDFAYTLLTNSSVSFHIQTLPEGGIDIRHTLKTSPDGIPLDNNICKLVNDLLDPKGLSALVKKIAAHLVQGLYTGSEIPTKFKRQRKKSPPVLIGEGKG